ncbi:MAG: PAS domain-containing protein [bacterium]|nr:PAS domain-containing protein [bacterium]
MFKKEIFIRYRKQKQMKLSYIARLMDKTYTSLYRWEKGLQEPSSSDIRVLAQILDIDVSIISDLRHFDNELNNNKPFDNINYAKRYEVNDIKNTRPEYKKLKNSNLNFKKTNDLLISNIDRYKRILDEMPSMFYIKGVDLKFRFANRAFMLLADSNHADDIVGKKASDIFTYKSIKQIIEYENKAIAECIPFTDIELILNVKRKKISVSLSIIPSLDENSEVKELFVYLTNLNEYFNVKNQSTYLQNLLINKNIIFYMRTEHTYTYVNDSVEKLTGIKANEFISNNKTFEEIINSDDLRKLKLTHNGFLECGKYKFRMKTLDGSHKNIASNVYRATDFNDSSDTYYGMMWEINQTDPSLTEYSDYQYFN